MCGGVGGGSLGNSPNTRRIFTNGCRGQPRYIFVPPVQWGHAANSVTPIDRAGDRAPLAWGAPFSHYVKTQGAHFEAGEWVGGRVGG